MVIRQDTTTSPRSGGTADPENGMSGKSVDNAALWYGRGWKENGKTAMLGRKVVRSEKATTGHPKTK